MLALVLSVISACIVSIALSSAQLFPTAEGVTITECAKHPTVSISYKQTWLCESSARAWAGYVHMPASYISSRGLNNTAFNASLFFWYFEARHNPQHAPTTLYFAGGPGQSSLYGAMSDGGPCIVLDNSNTTETNPWSMNTYSNILYIDQPVGTGFSYDALVKSTLNLISLDDIQSMPFSSYTGTIPPQNSTFYHGILPSSDLTRTTPTSLTAAKLLWQFSQIWFTEFPHWNTSDKRINLWGNSYGGFWTLISGQYFVQQNKRVEAGNLGDALILPLDSVGFTNGLIDLLRGSPYVAEFLYNNTYDLQVISKDLYEGAVHNFTKSNGCVDQLKACRELGYAYDPDFTARNDSVNAVCQAAEAYCFPLTVSLVTSASNRSTSDIAHIAPEPFPPNNLIGYLNRQWVREALGVPVNFTANSEVVTLAFEASGDFIRTDGFLAVEYLLENGVRITLVNGDRDPSVPWTSAEALSLQADWPGADTFRLAGYEYVVVNDSYKGGFVRQHANLSFVRLFQSGHDVAAYQPEANFEVFNRAIQHRDIATGRHKIDECGNDYSTTGSSSSWFYKSTLPPPLQSACYIYELSTCSDEQILALESGKALIEDWYVVEPAGPVSGTSGT